MRTCRSWPTGGRLASLGIAALALGLTLGTPGATRAHHPAAPSGPKVISSIQDSAVISIAFDPIPRGTPLERFLRVHVTRRDGGQPVTGATVTVAADMPAHSGAHRFPASAVPPTGAPGEYGARFRVPMPGSWLIRVRVSGSVEGSGETSLWIGPRRTTEAATDRREAVGVSFSWPDLSLIAIRWIHIVGAAAWLGLMGILSLAGLERAGGWMPGSFAISAGMIKELRYYAWLALAALWGTGILNARLANPTGVILGLLETPALLQLPFGESYFLLLVLKHVLGLALIGLAVSGIIARRRSRARLSASTGGPGPSFSALGESWPRVALAVGVLGTLAGVGMTYLHLLMHGGM